MIVYNVTIKIDSEIEKEWLEWMRKTHVPDVMDTGCFISSRIYRLRYPQEDEGITYAIQYDCEDMRSLELYHARHAQALQKDHSERFSNRFVSFRTILERVD